jgi:diguanylate cyclase (GGDEF)-like protein
VVVVIEGDDPAAIDDAIRRGAYDVLRRPVVPAEVGARLRAAARLVEARRAAREAARTDELTGLVTRRHLDDHLEMMASMARRLRAPFSILLVDVDRTRRINDEHGHAAGDAVVAEAARRLMHGLRSEDVAGRWGGDEFLVLLPHTPVDGAWRLADRVRAAVSDDPIQFGRGADAVVTVSIGCADGFGDDVEGQLRRAAQARDEAKQAGRNKVVAG